MKSDWVLYSERKENGRGGGVKREVKGQGSWTLGQGGKSRFRVRIRRHGR